METSANFDYIRQILREIEFTPKDFSQPENE